MRLKQFIQNRSKKTWVILTLVVIGIAAIAFIANTLSSPSEGKIIQAKDATEKPRSRDETVTVDGKTVSFSIYSRFKKVETDAPQGQEVEKFSYLNPETISQNLSIQIRKLPTGNLSDDSSYNVRKLNPGKYNAETKTINGNTVVIMSEPGVGFSKVAFMTHNGLEANIALTSTSNTEEVSMQKALDKVLGSWEWL